MHHPFDQDELYEAPIQTFLLAVRQKLIDSYQQWKLIYQDHSQSSINMSINDLFSHTGITTLTPRQRCSANINFFSPYYTKTDMFGFVGGSEQEARLSGMSAL